MAKARVFVDTNVILEALTGDPTEPGRVDMPAEVLTQGLAARHTVGKMEIASFALKLPERR